MNITKNKLFWGLEKRLSELMDEHVDLYFRERPWLEDPNQPHVKLDLSVRQKQNELQQKKVVVALLKALEKDTTLPDGFKKEYKEILTVPLIPVQVSATEVEMVPEQQVLDIVDEARTIFGS